VKPSVSKFLVFAALFGLGGVCGAALMRSYYQQQMIKVMRLPPPLARSEFRLQAMSRRLSLTKEQEDKIRVILERSEDEGHKIMEPCYPKLKQLKENRRTEIRKLLTPEQQQQQDAFDRAWKERRHHSHKRN
jgi:Spy/CpxP family protein refolding chaperone